jgi:type II secretory pathway pseudopilin PulG
MKSKTPLTLMELLIMLLIFSIASALCVQMFVKADGWSKENQIEDRALLSLQSVAETVKASGGNLDLASDLLDGIVLDDTLRIFYDEMGQPVAKSDEAVYDIIVETFDSGEPLLGTASVTARTLEEEETLFRITAAWQEVERNE